jgi:lipopolysaccharide/colanic/teichoic acid biosynthesis glycosyltransferase
MSKRIIDIVLSLSALVILMPLLLFIAIWIATDSRGGVFYIQGRVGKDNRDFSMLKFRTMRPGADTRGLLTVGGRDPRVTGAGYYLRKAKLDELPQLLNILVGDMSIVGPRPEVRKYVDHYTPEQMKVLSVRPGLTDYASLEYIDEDELLSQSKEPEKTYLENIMPAKLELNLRYIRERNTLRDLGIILKTLRRLFM